MSTCQVIILDSKAPKSGAKPIDSLVMIVLHYGRMQCKEYTQSNWMSTNHTNRKSNKCRINYYLQPLVFDLLYSLFAASFGFSKTLISHERWCSTEEENKLRDEFRDQKQYIQRCGFLSKTQSCLCHHFRTAVGHVPRLQGMWKMCGRLGHRGQTTLDKLPQLKRLINILWMLWACNRNNILPLGPHL